MNISDDCSEVQEDNAMQLTEHFSLEELIASEIATRRGIDNSPPISFDVNIRHLADGLEAIRSLLNNFPIHITSGYRCPELNRIVFGRIDSAHMLGLAADLICPGFGTPRVVCQTIIKSPLGYEQCILEFNSWCHIAFAQSGAYAKRENLIIDSYGARSWV